MKSLERFIAACALALVPALACAGPTVLRTLMQEGSAPKYILADGRPQGHCPDILRAIERAEPLLQFDLEAKLSSIRRIEDNLRAGHIDVFCGLLDTPLRNEIARRAPTPVFFVRERLIGRRDDTLVVKSLQDIAQTGDRVATQAGASYASSLRNAGIQVDESSGDSAQALRNVANHRVRYYYTNELTGLYYIRVGDWSEQLVMLPLVLQETPSYLWISRHLDANTSALLERTLARLQKEGVLKKIYASYLNPP